MPHPQLLVVEVLLLQQVCESHLNNSKINDYRLIQILNIFFPEEAKEEAKKEESEEEDDGDMGFGLFD